jgi:S1-C subfamily serine protease
MLDREQLHERILYPVTRVRAEKAGGSGVIVYSQPDPKKPQQYINIVLTCEHVVDEAIKIRDDWDTVLKRQRKQDFFEEVTVDVFDYDGSKVVSSNATQADIVAYDKRHDLAALRLHNPRQMPYVASIIPKREIEDLRVFDPVWVSGCSLLHDPFANPGTLTYLREVIEQKTYIMANAASIFGNSGGGLFHAAEGHLLGLTSRITAIQLGFGVDVLTWMGFSTHPERLYEFFEDQELHFLFDPKDDYHKAMERRRKRRQEALRTLLLEEQRIEPEPLEPSAPEPSE